MKRFWKKYGKMIAAAVFLTVAGLCYCFAGSQDATISLQETGAVLSQTKQQTGVSLESIAESEHETIIDVPMCFVHICGEVMQPGVYEVAEGSRLFEVLELAGGFTDEAAEASLNLASQVSDGMQIVILSKAEEEQKNEAEAEQASALVNINKASKDQLMTLPGIGESRAEDIIRYREESGGFSTIEDIMKVSGIKDAAFQKIKDSIVV